MSLLKVDCGKPAATMHRLILLIVAVNSLFQSVQTLTMEDYDKARSDLISEETRLALGGNLSLSDDEIKANAILMSEKNKEIADGFANPGNFNPANHFFLRKSKIEESPVFQIIRKMPKGAALHVHDTALIGSEYLVKNITYRDNLYILQKTETDIVFKFSNVRPTTDWQLMSDLRKSAQNVTEFDAKLAQLFTLEVDNPKSEYPNINEVWRKFGYIFGRVFSLLTYKPVWEDYFYEALRQYREDNILYIELRTTLPELYDLNGKTYSPVDCAKAYKSVNDRFKKDYPDSFGARIIYAPVRKVVSENVREYIQILKTIEYELGDFVAGFDLVGQEDAGQPLKDFIPELLQIPKETKVFYHAGETNWFGTDTDFNLIDAILLNAKRLGHAYGLLKHPSISNIVKKKQIAIEVSPLSNQILMLVEDMRNHPASIMLAENYPVVISSDDPGLWGALPLSHDMYEAFIGLASKTSDIRLLKQLAENSIKFSSMGTIEMESAMLRFKEQWKSFIKSIH